MTKNTLQIIGVLVASWLFTGCGNNQFAGSSEPAPAPAKSQKQESKDKNSADQKAASKPSDDDKNQLGSVDSDEGDKTALLDLSQSECSQTGGNWTGNACVTCGQGTQFDAATQLCVGSDGNNGNNNKLAETMDTINAMTPLITQLGSVISNLPKDNGGDPGNNGGGCN